MASQRFSEELRSGHAERWRALLDHAFLRGLASGDLPLACFVFHQRQDWLYLDALAEALAAGLERSRSSQEALVLGELRAGALAEQAQIEARAPALGVVPRELSATEPTEVTRRYGASLRRAAREARGELLAALLPCALLYPAVAVRHQGAVPASPLFRAWLTSCAAPELQQLAARSAAALDARAAGASGAETRRWSQAYAASLRLERLFLQAALERRSWPADEEVEP